MRRSEAARYARWSVALALVLTLATAGAYLKTKWSQHVDRRNAPAPAPVNVERQSNGLTFSKVEGDRKIFTVTASKSTDFKDRNATLLESVEITIFGKAGDRNDVVRTESCQYSRNTGAIDCSGSVRMDLQSAADAERAAHNSAWQSQVVHVETSRVTFDRANGLARTSQPVKFVFPSGRGEALGVEYRSEEGSVKLLSDVQFTLQPPAPASAVKKPALQGPANIVHIRGSSLDFDRNRRKMRLQGPAEARTETVRLSSNEMLLDFDSAFRAQAFRAQTGNGNRPVMELHAGGDSSRLTADTLVAYFSSGGWVSRSEASGDVQGSRETTQETEDFRAAAVSLDLWPKVTQPKELRLQGAVVVKTRTSQSSESRTLQTELLQIQFSGGAAGQASKPQLAQTLAPGTLEWTDASPQTNDPPRTKLSADKLEMQFSPAGKPERLLANRNVRAERALPGHATQTATAKNGVTQLLAGGGWSQIELQGAVGLKEGERRASADRAVFVRDAQTATLTGKAVVRDTTTETTASRIVFHQATGDILAEGGVRSTDLSVRGTAVQLASAPANITADTLQANSKSGRALYSSHSRLWQGDSVLEADSIELQRQSRTLTATDHVRAVFPQAPAAPNSQHGTAAKRSNLWHITAGTLTYYDLENRAHLEHDVVAQSAGQRIRSRLLDLYFTRAPAGSSAQTSGALQINRGTATGSVSVEEGTRRAVAERGEYSAADGKFVMSGGSPTIFDGSAGATTGRQLTFFLADDTIIVDSENGSRTVTKHRVDR